ncbi:MAG: TetR/AcrR family transcriptional regulator C-terminal domain-containing protein [Amphiplicatus sp.]
MSRRFRRLIPEAPSRDRLTAIGEQYQRVILEPKRVRMARLTIAEATSFPDLARRYFESGPSYACGRLSDFLATATERGELKIQDAPLAASQFLGLLKGVDHLGALLGIDSAEGEPQRKRRLAAAIDTFLKLYG